MNVSGNILFGIAALTFTYLIYAVSARSLSLVCTPTKRLTSLPSLRYIQAPPSKAGVLTFYLFNFSSFSKELIFGLYAYKAFNFFAVLNVYSNTPPPKAGVLTFYLFNFSSFSKELIFGLYAYKAFDFFAVLNVYSSTPAKGGGAYTLLIQFQQLRQGAYLWSVRLQSV